MEFTGLVTGGSRKAAQLGYPTANILLADTEVSGIYAARVVSEGQEYSAVAYADQTRHILEAHLFRFSGDLYGKEITVTLEMKLRDSERFDTEDALKEAVENDIAAARAYFKL